MKTVQMALSEEYLERCSAMSIREIAKFLDDFRRLQVARKSTTKLISIKVPEDLLEAFKTKSMLEGLRYQTQTKHLMRDWLNQEP
jgi:predicted DNA binding CopG/RHH family protein